MADYTRGKKRKQSSDKDRKEGRSVAEAAMRAFGRRDMNTPSGGRHTATKLCEEMVFGEAKLVIRKLLDAALAGDPTCLRLVVERLMPVRKENPCSIRIGALKSVDDVSVAMRDVISQVASGELTIGQGKNMLEILKGFSDNIALGENMKRGDDGVVSLVEKLRSVSREMDAMMNPPLEIGEEG